MLNHCTPGSLWIIKFLTGGISGFWGAGGGILEQYLGFGEQLSVTKPDPVYDKKFLKYKPGLGQPPTGQKMKCKPSCFKAIYQLP